MPFSTVSDALYGRLTDADVESVVAAMDADDQELVRRVGTDRAEYHRTILHLGAYYQLPEVLSKTGLTTATPPEKVHSMGRGKMAAGGSSYYADLVLGAIEAAGAQLSAGAQILDFGCSSGRVIRFLHAYDSSFACYGCDPNKDAIEWAQANLQPITFAVSPLRPPLMYASNTFDLVFAISIWSHMNQKSSRAWLREMRRILKPGGYLLLTFHGSHSVSYYRAKALRHPRVLGAITRGLNKRGFAFWDVFGKSGDWGVKDKEWGEAYFTPRWLAANSEPDWQLLYYRAGLVEGNQDIAVLKDAG